MNYDVFNGDADGIIALMQLRFAHPKPAQLVTGVKRDIALLNRIGAQAGDEITVLDISMAKNATGLIAALDAGAHVFYADHHESGDIPQHESLDAHIDLQPNTCTSLIIDRLLEGQFHLWAITAAFGDNLLDVGNKLALEAGLTQQQASQLCELGTLINYNGYGTKVEDLHFAPEVLYQRLMSYPSPFDVIKDVDSPFLALKTAYDSDLQLAISTPALHDSDAFLLIQLPDEAWSRRVSGVYGNYLANRSPDKAHGVLTDNGDGSFTFSLRAPLNNKQGANEICRQFDTGGGRAAAAGINQFYLTDLAQLIDLVTKHYWSV